MKFFGLIALLLAVATSASEPVTYEIEVEVVIPETATAEDVGAAITEAVAEGLAIKTEGAETGGRKLQTYTVLDGNFVVDSITFYSYTEDVVSRLCTDNLFELTAAQKAALAPGTMCRRYVLSWKATLTTRGGPFAVVFENTNLSTDIKDYITFTLRRVAVPPARDPTVRTVTLLGVEVIANGDPHFKTLSGNWFEYHGECDLVFMHAAGFKDGKDIAVHARTSIRQSYSFITSAAVRIGESTLEVASYGAYAFNGVDSADLSKETFEGYKINYYKPNKKNTIFEIVFSDSQKIVLSAFKDLVAIKMIGFGSEFANSSGLLGTTEGKLLGRDGVTEFTDMNAFGQEWQVRDTEPMLFRSARAPQFPTETCRLPKVSMEDTRRRLGEGMAREKAERACAHFSGVQFENCVFDVMAVGDIELAQAGAY